MKFRLGRLVISFGDACDLEECDYFTHYLRYGGPAMSHQAFHQAVKECLRAQQTLENYLERNKTVPDSLLRYVERLENQVRA